MSDANVALHEAAVELVDGLLEECPWLKPPLEAGEPEGPCSRCDDCEAAFALFHGFVAGGLEQYEQVCYLCLTGTRHDCKDWPEPV